MGTTFAALAAMALSVPAAAGTAAYAVMALANGAAPVPRALPQKVTAVVVADPSRARPPQSLRRPSRAGHR